METSQAGGRTECYQEHSGPGAVAGRCGCAFGDARCENGLVEGHAGCLGLLEQHDILEGEENLLPNHRLREGAPFSHCTGIIQPPTAIDMESFRNLSRRTMMAN